jgi:hypothetical protein
MVQPTPFQRLLQDISKDARTDPAAAFARMEEAFGKTTSEADLLQFCSFLTNLGAGALGRFAETESLLKRCLAHPALPAESPVRRSLLRALAVTLLCADRKPEAQTALGEGITTPSEECRFAIGMAQTLLARTRPLDALPYLKRATELCPTLPENDEVLAHTAAIAANFQRIAEPQAQLAQQLLLGAAEAAAAAVGRAGDWQASHKALFALGRSWLIAGSPAKSLKVVQRMLALEREHAAGAVPRFYSANLACRAQAMRGQVKIARAAWKACQEFAAEAEQAGEPLGPPLEDLERAVASAEADAATPR